MMSQDIGLVRSTIATNHMVKGSSNRTMVQSKKDLAATVSGMDYVSMRILI